MDFNPLLFKLALRGMRAEPKPEPAALDMTPVLDELSQIRLALETMRDKTPRPVTA